MQIGPVEIRWVGLKQNRGKLTKDEKALVHDGRYIDAIKAYKERTGQSLKESKDAVDRYRGN